MKKVNWVYKKLQYKARILHSWIVNDEKYLKRKFRKKFGRELNLASPTTFNEKIAHRMLFEAPSKFTKFTDKISARSYVENTVGKEYLVPVLGIYKKFDEIDFNQLPDKFVLKCNHDSASTIICTGKLSFPYEYARKKLTFCLSRSMYPVTREQHYNNIVPRLICESYIDVFKDKNPDITPELYRVHCFSGKAQYIEVDFTKKNGTECINIYNTQWDLLQMTSGYPNNNSREIKKPGQLIKLLLLSENLTTNFEYCRMDWFIANERIYFSEFTFTPCAGRMIFQPAHYDILFGSFWTKNKSLSYTVHHSVDV